jgi:branched-chain amino acid:cation transporter, LIVCS family
MKKYMQSTTITTGLAIFAMLFGAGNLIYPIKVGITAGNRVGLGLLAFIISGVLLPVMGLIGMALFEGDYRAFFYRIGKIPGTLLIFFCMLTIGPLLVMPRIVALTYELMRPFIGQTISIATFSILFSLLTFICCYKENSIVNLLGKLLSPLKLATLFTIIAIGIWTRKPPLINHDSPSTIFITNFERGYGTLDLLGAIFFAYIIVAILKRTLDTSTASNTRTLAKIILRGGLIGGSLLAIVYIGMGYLAAFHGQSINPCLDPGKMFILTMMNILGSHGALFISVTVLVACLSTMIALASVVAEYLRQDIFHKKISYITGLILVLITTTCMAQFELGPLLAYSEPLLFIGYPVFIMLTLCNIAYKMGWFNAVKVPVLITFIASTIVYGPAFVKLLKEGLPKIEANAELAQATTPA